MTITVKWLDGGREPKVKPNPDYPNGIDIDLAPNTWGCKVPVPYPAKRCGAYELKCDICGAGALVTTAGRVDDPRSVRLHCNVKNGAVQ